ncbi:hypothetical protein BV25DRAFT_1818970 [Artomyces pyxidatus]|uniref:Uncharacterized protein n=1 Tax=Artomyces pyxidatus TaxID=48021 RepID=A0ACB8TGL7_9AGAM|nr:hypothetical protein BV25DRAFT_1818970 [Artomyces pyxidatus]
MSQANQPSYSPSFRASWFPPSRFKEHLSLTVPPHDAPVEQSHFSPESPPPPRPETTHSRSFSLGSSTMYKPSPQSKMRDLEKGSSPHSSPHSAGFRDRFTRLFFEIRAGKREPELDIPIQDPEALPLAQWPPLNVRKQCSCHQETPLQMWRRRAWLAALVLFLFYVFINLLVLDARVFSSSHAPTNSTSALAPAPASGLSADTQQCIDEYTLNAPSSPTTYPCSTCLPLVSVVPSNLTSVYPTAVDATQFCALRAFWEDAGSSGQSALEAIGWVEDVKFCAWGGVRCDGTGRVSSLQLTFPAIPTSIPAEIGDLTALEAFELIGNNAVPGGPFPQTFSSLSGLASIHFESTALGALPDVLQNVTSLTLVSNAQMGQALPTTISQSSLQTLIVNNENITLTSAQQTAICNNALGGHLQTCDLRGTGIQSCGSCLVG